MAISDAVTLVNAAISRSNGNPIAGADFSGTDVESVLANLNYEDIVRSALEAAPWRFARKTDAMTLVVDGDSNPIPPADPEWRYQWALPNDVLMLRTVLSTGICAVRPPYQIDQEGIVLANARTGLYAVYTYRADETLWPSDFKEGIKRWLEALYFDMDERTNEADDRMQQAEKQLVLAANRHAQEEYPRDPRRIPLISVRRTGYAPCRY